MQSSHSSDTSDVGAQLFSRSTHQECMMHPDRYSAVTASTSLADQLLQIKVDERKGPSYVLTACCKQ
jgi:hypothetical protein